MQESYGENLAREKIRGPDSNGTVEMLLARGLGLGVTVVCFYDPAKLGIEIDCLPVLG